jgi:preprotein translocase subunit YajC
LAESTATSTSTGTPTGTGQAAGPDLFGMIFTFVPLILIFWLFFIRPESKRRKQKEALLGSLKVKDKVITGSGIYGTVMEIEGNEVTLLIDAKKDVRIKVVRAAVDTVIQDDEKK